MLINLRNALMAGKRLPYDAEVEYLESSGTQYINTGIKPGPNTRAEIVFAMTTFTANCGLFGARGNATADNNSYNLFIINNSGARVRWDWSGSGQYQTSEAATSTVATYVLGAAGGNITRDGVTVMSVSASKAAINYPLYVFNFNNVGTPYSTGANARVWSVKIYDGQTLVFDGIPVRKGTTGELYDRVSGKFAERHGDFVVGSDVVPVEYIDFTGSQYLDFGFKPTQSTTVSIDIIPAVTGVNNIGWSSAGNGAGVKYECYGWTNRAQIYYGNEADTTWVAQVGDHIKIQLGKVSKFENLTRGTKNTKTFTDTSFTAAYNLTVGALNRGGYSYFAKMHLNSMSVSGDRTVNCVPVRVGTEGAMMDVLTRRIYRNAGTGAFTYGNDLKYPIPAE